MMDNERMNARRGGWPWRMIGWGGVVGILLLPLVAGAPWTLSDYLIMGMLLGIVGMVLELVVRASTNKFYRAGAGVAVLAAFLLVWVNGAVGFLGDEDNPANLMFFGVLVIGLLGAIIANFRAAGMARAMVATAIVQVLVGVIGFTAGWASPGFKGIYEVVMGTGIFALLWLLSAALFRHAAGQQAATVL